MAIQANELRVGNLFFDEDNALCYFAGAWQRNDGWICRDSASNTYKESQIYPIPLTSEILEQWCGFVKEQRMFYKGIYFVGLIGYNGGFGVRNTTGIIATLQYLHQLQNLIYALSGEELPVILPVV